VYKSKYVCMYIYIYDLYVHKISRTSYILVAVTIVLFSVGHTLMRTK
jgi:hypothetical protein